MDAEAHHTPKQKVGQTIGARLGTSGWGVQDNDLYLDAWQSVDSDHGAPLAVAIRVFREDPKLLVEEFNEVLMA